jgi:hypothetical protein
MRKVASSSNDRTTKHPYVMDGKILHGDRGWKTSKIVREIPKDHYSPIVKIVIVPTVV